MGFGTISNPSEMAKTQDDLVAERVKAKPDIIEEEMDLPGLPNIHLMGEGELINFLTTALKTRRNVRGMELTLGEDYEQTEKQITIPKSNTLHSLEYGDVARVLAMALAAGGENCIGFRTVTVVDSEGEISSRLYTKTAKKPPIGPSFDAKGSLVSEGDSEFCPKMILISKP